LSRALGQSRHAGDAQAPRTVRGRASKNGRPDRETSWLAGGERAPLRARVRAFETFFDSVLPPADALPASLHEAMRYSALGPGKRLRPLLALTACEAAGGRYERALPAAAAVELVHAFSLVHDDLPSMDDDDYRRGRLTTHRKYGEATALLAGDALLALAFAALARLEERGVPARAVTRAVRVLAEAAGSHVLVGGQVLDLEGEKRRVTGEDVREIHLRKTGGLIRAALLLGGLAAAARPAMLRTLGRIGLELGFAFQIHDDLLNRRSTLARLGKRAGTDEARGKATYPRAVGEPRARAEAARLFVGALRALEPLGARGRNLGHLILAVAERER
jgi:geranylgeranyl diphosphate synthase type II